MAGSKFYGALTAATLALSPMAANSEPRIWDNQQVIPVGQETSTEKGILSCATDKAIRDGITIDVAGVTATFPQLHPKRGVPYISGNTNAGYVNAFLTERGGVEISVADKPVALNQGTEPFYRINAAAGSRQIRGEFQQVGSSGVTSEPARELGRQFASGLTACARFYKQAPAP